MQRLSKYQVIAFVFLILVGITEIFSYFLIITPRLSVVSNLQQNNKNQLYKTSKTEVDENTDLAVSLDMLGYLRRLSNDILLSSQIILVQEGEIGAIDRQPGITDSNNRSVNYAVRITLKKNGKSVDLYYNDHDLSIAKAVQVIDGGEKLITLSDLSVGSIVRVREVFDVKKDVANSLTELTITKIR